MTATPPPRRIERSTLAAAALFATTAVAVAVPAPWWVLGALLPPAVLWAPGLGWARLLDRHGAGTGLQRALDAAWIAMATAWLDVSLVGLLDLPRLALLALAAGWWGVGTWLGRSADAPAAASRVEVVAACAAALAVVSVLAWRADDIARPLDGYWWLAGADDDGHERLPIEAGTGWAEVQALGWDEAGALRLRPAPGQEHTLVTDVPLQGRLVLAVRGPVGSRLRVLGEQTEVQASVAEDGEASPVRRYLEWGTAGLAIELSLQPGEALPVVVDGDWLYVMPGTDAVWSLHADGDLRYTHYWQILNQVEQLDWAADALAGRPAGAVQPPGWSPLLAAATALGKADMPTVNLLFLWVLALTGAQAARLVALVAPGAPKPAWLLPAAGVGSLALLALEPGSAGMPDTLYAAALVAAASSLAGRRAGWFAAAGLAAALLRWPGLGASTLVALAWWGTHRGEPTARRGLVFLWAAALVTAGLVVAGWADRLDEVGRTLWFETVPEHWHDEFRPAVLLRRVPGFYALWLAYSGGGLALALVGAVGRERRAGRALLAAALAYSLVLSTVDHHPTHYFLPLVALTGPALAAGCADRRWLGTALSTACLLGTGWLLAGGVVW